MSKMSKLEIQKFLLENKALLKEKYKVKRIGIFGSYVRGEETADSDIDLLVEFSEPIGLDYFRMKEYIEKSLGRKVDLVSTKALHVCIKDDILSEVEYVN